jgi:hypothetical protein
VPVYTTDADSRRSPWRWTSGCMRRARGSGASRESASRRAPCIHLKALTPWLHR